MRILLATFLLGACVKGNPITSDPQFLDTGGTLEIPGCGYTLTTREGAEQPRLASALGITGSDPTPRLVHLGFMGDPKTSIVAQWRTVDEETTVTRIRFGVGDNLTADQLTEERDGVEFRYRATGMDTFRQHQAHLCDLTPGTTYSYQVGSPGNFSPVYTFHTAPDLAAAPDIETLFGVIGDSRDGYDIWEQLVNILIARAPDLILFTGDAVTIGLTQNEWEEFFGRAEPLLARTPLVFAHGNHEVNAAPYYSQVALPGDQENFGFDYGYVHVTVANDTPRDINAIPGAYRTAMVDDFERSKNSTWRVLMHHQPIWSSATAHGSSMFLQEHWMPVIDQYGIDLVLAGHDHDFEVSNPLRASAVQGTSATGTVYAVVGGAGAELYGIDDDLFHSAYAESTYSASTLRATKNLLELEAFRPDGSAIADTDPRARFTKTK